jgi:hypothetical protein
VFLLLQIHWMQQTDDAWPLQQEVELEVDAAYRCAADLSPAGQPAGQPASQPASCRVLLLAVQSSAWPAPPASLQPAAPWSPAALLRRFIIDREIEAPDRFQAIQSYR